MAQRHIIIGDVHGMAEELRQLMREVGLSKLDKVVFAGDLLDKGPHSCAVVGYALSLRDQGVDVVLVKGNHEDKHERFRKAFAKAGDKVKMKGLEELKAITAGLSEFEIDFLESAVPFHHIPEHDAVVLHGGILPAWEKLDASDKSITGPIMRVRYVTGKATAKVTVEFSFDGDDVPGEDLARAIADGHWSDFAEVRRKVRPAGSFVSLGQEQPDDPFWADVYDGRFGHVYFGHNPWPGEDEPKQFEFATGLDTGAVFGGKLSAAVLEEGQEPRFVSVQASGKFATALWDE
jgi:serine/threonine protein phosphatase 1